MQGGLYRAKSSNNDSAITILWIGIISYALGFFLPQITITGGLFTRFTWQLLNPILILLIFVSIGLLYKGITKAKLYQDIKIYGIGSSLIMLIPLLEITSQRNDLNSEIDIFFGYDAYRYGFGYYLLWMGLIFSTVGSLNAKTTPPSSPIYPVNQHKAYQRNNQYYPPPQYQQKPLDEPPSYAETEKTVIQSTSYTEADQYPNTQPDQPIQRDQFCGNCGHHNKVGSQFCDNCGQKQ